MHPTALALLSTLAIPSGETPEWGGFRGNNGCGLAARTQLAEALDPEANLAWKVEVPTGYSSPTVAGDRVFLTGAEDKELFTLCVDLATGEEHWRRAIEFDGSRPGANSPAAPSPATDGERVYAFFHSAGLHVFDLEGEPQWSADLGSFNIPHGMSTSPVIHGDTLVVLVDQDLGAYLVAFDKRTGEERWRTARPGVTHSYSTPAVYTPEDGPAQVVVSGSFQISGYSIETGEKLWWLDGASWQSKSVPVIVDDVCVVNSYMVAPTDFGLPSMQAPWEEVLAERDADGSGAIEKAEWDHDMLQRAWFIFDLNDDGALDEEDYKHASRCGRASGGLFAVRMGGKGNVTDSHLVWRNDDRRGLPDIPSPVVVDGIAYLIKEGGLMTAIDVATGKRVKQARVGEPDKYYASPIAAAGRIVTASESGQLAVVAAGPEWEVLSVHQIDDEVWSTPAIAGGKVLVRGLEHLYCFDAESE